ncbi:MAG: phage virion morphogenesis protein [Polyangiaceae bacterium]
MKVDFKVSGAPLGGTRDARGRYLQTSPLKRALTANLSETLLDLVREGFEKQRDPSGSRWAATERGGRILQDTGRLRNSWHRRAGNSQFTVSSSVKYGSFHQSGARHLKARKMVPDGELPAHWGHALNDTAQAVLKDWFGG